MRRRKPLVRDFHAASYLDLFLVSAVSAILGIRFYLHLTGYPQVGGATLHVAHMLWGGLLMLAALLVLLSYLGRGAHQLAALLGGLGFGTFIDEVGKFVTRDHDYFYRPAVALIYIIFVLVYLAVRTIHAERHASPDEYLVNALHEMENVAFEDLDSEERDRALRYLDQSDRSDPLVAGLREILGRSDVVPTPSPHPLVRLRSAAIRLYRRLAESPAFFRVVVVFFVAQLAFKAGHTVYLTLAAGGQLPMAAGFGLGGGGRGRPLTLTEWAQLASSILSGFLVLAGLLQLYSDRLRALRTLQGSVLVSIFLTQVFMFYQHQWLALGVLVFQLAVLAALNFMIEHEGERSAPAPVLD